MSRGGGKVANFPYGNDPKTPRNRLKKGKVAKVANIATHLFWRPCPESL